MLTSADSHVTFNNSQILRDPPTRSSCCPATFETTGNKSIHCQQATFCDLPHHHANSRDFYFWDGARAVRLDPGADQHRGTSLAHDQQHPGRTQRPGPPARIMGHLQDFHVVPGNSVQPAGHAVLQRPDHPDRQRSDVVVAHSQCHCHRRGNSWSAMLD